MFRFANIEFLYLLLLVPLLMAVYGLASRRRYKLVERFGNYEILRGLMPDFSQGRL